jgi:hypothetical protein
MANNFTSVGPNLNAAYAAQTTFGTYNRQIWTRINVATTAITAATMGQCTAQRYPIRPVIPAVGAGCDGFIATNISCLNEDGNTAHIIGLEYLLGTITAPNTFTDGVAMPIKKVRGTSVQTAASIIFAVTDATISGSPTVNVTYTDQNGNTGNTFNFVCPAIAVANTALMINNRMTTDTGIRDITAMSVTGLTGGNIKVYGILPLYMSVNQTTEYRVPLLAAPLVPYLLQAGEFLGAYRLFNNSTNEVFISMNLTPEPT